jgi:DNA-binding CsgD family transcriptional regulator
MGDRVSKPIDPPGERLTRREREILALLEQDLSNQEIAQKLSLAVSSTKWHISQIYGKLGVNNRRQALRRARELGLLQSNFPAPTVSGMPEPRPTQPLPTGTVTFLFTDVEASTRMLQSAGDAWPALLSAHDRLLRTAIRAGRARVDDQLEVPAAEALERDPGEEAADAVGEREGGRLRQ